MTQIRDDEIKYKFDNISMSFISVIGDKIITKQRVFSPKDGDVNRKNHFCAWMTQCFAYITLPLVNSDLPRVTSGLFLLLVVGAVS